MGKGWVCLHCPEKRLKQSRDIDNHIESKAHAENRHRGVIRKLVVSRCRN